MTVQSWRRMPYLREHQYTVPRPRHQSDLGRVTSNHISTKQETTKHPLIETLRAYGTTLYERYQNQCLQKTARHLNLQANLRCQTC